MSSRIRNTFLVLLPLFSAISACTSWGKFWDTSASPGGTPAVTSANSAAGSSNLSAYGPLIITFSQDMDSTSITTTGSGNACTGSLQYSLDNFSTCIAGTLSFPSLKQASFVPSSPFCVESQYTLQVRILTSVKAANGINLASPYNGSFSFSTQQALLRVGVTAGTTVQALAVSCNTLYVGGTFSQVGGLTRTNLAAIDLATGMLNGFDATNFSAAGSVFAMALDGNNLIVGGTFATAGGQARTNLVAFDATTGLVTSWNPAPNNTVSALAVSNGSIYVGGNFTSASCGARNRLALFTSGSSTCDATWNPGSTVATVSALAVSGGNVFVGGSFTTSTIGGLTRSYLASVSATGSGTGNAGFCGTAPIGAVNAIAVQGTSVFAGGAFGGGLCGNTIYSFGAVDSSTGALNGYPSGAGTGAGNIVYAISMSATRVYAGGAFTGAASFFNNTRNYVGATDLAGAISTWDPNLNGNVNAIANLGTSIFLGGAFTTANGGTVVNRLTLVDATTGTVRP